MKRITRRQFAATAASLGASLAWGQSREKTNWRESRAHFPEGVASGDPHPDSVLLWTRRPPINGSEARQLTVEIAEDQGFERVVANANAALAPEADWTCRILAAGLKPSREYWYRFTDEHGFGSRIGRTITAPNVADDRPVRFAFVSCQNVTQGAQNAYRRMIFEDERQPAADRLSFVLHLGDFVYEIVWYPEDRPQGMYARRIRDVVRYEHGEKIDDFHVPTTVDDYRALYRGYLHDPDLQDARARWPFICMWDNHEFSWKGWQSQQNFGGVRPAQTRKVAANQAWFEYQPARVVKSDGPSLDRFEPPKVKDAPISKFNDSGLGVEENNLAAINSLKLFRSFRWGRNVDLILTDNRSYTSECVMQHPEAAQFQPKDFPWVVPEEVVDVLDAGRTYRGGRPPESIRFGGRDLPNPRKNSPAQSVLGAEQKAWFFERLRASKARWKLWGNSIGMLDWRTDFQNLPEEFQVRWPGAGFAIFSADDWGGYRTERAEILNLIRHEKITGFASLAGDRHSFFAGVLSESLPPRPFDPVAVEFITGSVSAPGLFEAAEYRLPKDHPLRAIFLQGHSPAMNLTALHGVRASLALAKTGDLKQALAQSNPEVSPHLSFLDLGGHGYATVRATSAELETEFVCIPRPLERSDRVDGGPLTYRVSHRVKLWPAGTRPRLDRTILEGDPALSIGV